MRGPAWMLLHGYDVETTSARLLTVLDPSVVKNHTQSNSMNFCKVDTVLVWSTYINIDQMP